MSLVQYRTPGAVTLTGTSAGPTTGQPVILLHGAGRTRNSWDETVAELARRGFRTLAIDLRGHGESEWAPNGNYSMDALAEDVRAIVDSCPALLIRGSSSELVGENDVQEFLRIVPHAEYLEIAEATHAAADGRDRMVARSVGEFVSRVTVPDRPEHLK